MTECSFTVGFCSHLGDDHKDPKTLGPVKVYMEKTALIDGIV